MKQNTMIIIGLTGSMAMGKSTAATMLDSMDGVAVLCSDDVVRDLYKKRDVIEMIKVTFPATYDKKTASIDKQKLLEELGTDHEKWDALEEILHPYVIEAQQKFIRDQRTMGTKMVVLDIPLLFETGAEQRLDYTICVTAPAFMQHDRIQDRINRGLLSAENAEFRLSRQMPDADKRARSDFIVQSGQGEAYTLRELTKIITDLKRKHFGNGHEHRRIPPYNM